MSLIEAVVLRHWSLRKSHASSRVLKKERHVWNCGMPQQGKVVLARSRVRVLSRSKHGQHQCLDACDLQTLGACGDAAAGSGSPANDKVASNEVHQLRERAASAFANAFAIKSCIGQ